MITIYGVSDDLIEIQGDIREEFGYHSDEDGDLLAISDGTVLRIKYDSDGVWRITPVTKGANLVTIEQAPANDEDNYSDKATVAGIVAWVVQGIAKATP